MGGALVLFLFMVKRFCILAIYNVITTCVKYFYYIDTPASTESEDAKPMETNSDSAAGVEPSQPVQANSLKCDE